ncbi:MAG: hypothetical protein FGM51_00230 [Polynucleobacter sp.]|jgi:hypothetical protein|nr:hypothetical protein [Polynucleobacter sp.]
MRKLRSSLLPALLVGMTLGVAHDVKAQESALTIPHVWTCSNNERFVTSGPAEKLIVQWRSKSYAMLKEQSLPGSMRFKNYDSGLDLVVIGPKAMLFNIKTGIRLADECKTIAMKEGNEAHLLALEK